MDSHGLLRESAAPLEQMSVATPTELIAKSIVSVTATGERDPLVVKERAVNALGVRRICGLNPPLRHTKD
jgi:hypothetical protein